MYQTISTFSPNSDDTAPILQHIHTPATDPILPPNQKKAWVLLGFDLTPMGKAVNVNLVLTVGGTGGGSALINTAKRLLKKARYQPQVTNGKPVWSYGQRIKIVFTPTDEKEI